MFGWARTSVIPPGPLALPEIGSAAGILASAEYLSFRKSPRPHWLEAGPLPQTPTRSRVPDSAFSEVGRTLFVASPARSVLSLSVSGSCSQSKPTAQTVLLFSNISIRAVIHSIRIQLTVEYLGIFKVFCAVFVGCSGLQRGFPLAPHLLVVFQPASVGLEMMPLALVNDRHR